MSDDKRLYGLPDAEQLHYEPAEVVEEWLNDALEDDEPRFTIEEWSVLPPREHFPSVDALLDWINEWVCDNGQIAEGFETDETAESRAAAEALLDTIAASIPWRMADQKLRTLAVTPNPDDPENPLLDGRPTWTRSS